jgi:cephalosporin hydroxylase
MSGVKSMIPIEDNLGENLQDFWMFRIQQHFLDTYAGVRISKFPEDLRVYEMMMWDHVPNVVIEIGAQFGGSTLWFRDRLADLARYRPHIGPPKVISIDITMQAALPNIAAADPTYADTITLIEHDICDPAILDVIAPHLPPDARPFIIEDSAHIYATTAAALQHLAPLVAPGGYFVVEDGCVDIEAMRADPNWPRGVLPAVEDFLAGPEGSRFFMRRNLEHYGITCHPRGFLQAHPTPVS